MSAMNKESLELNDLSNDPIEQFSTWFSSAAKSGQTEPEAGCFATATPDGRPSARIVLLKHYDSSGFVVFTNYTSRKAAELKVNPRAALTFYWPVAGRQVRIEGSVESTSREENLAYFASRPYESRLGAWASSQSSVISSREELLERFEQIKKKYADEQAVPLPDFWGGYRITPIVMEFWQQGSHRLHDRFRYNFSEGCWEIARLAP